MPDTALAVRDLKAWYGESLALDGASFDVGRGEVVTLLGRNGAGKTTILRSIMGLVRRQSGSIVFEGREIGGCKPEQVARLGIAYCPEERGIFASLSAEENMLLPPVIRPGGMSVEEVYRLFPNLAERRASSGSKLSGGEQQMLAMGRILRTGATLLLLDEPTEGLAPVIVQQIGRVVAGLKERGYTLLLVEQNVRFAASLADRHHIVENGRIVDTLSAAELERDRARTEKRLGV